MSDAITFAPLINYAVICVLLAFSLWSQRKTCEEVVKKNTNSEAVPNLNCDNISSSLILFFIAFGVFQYFLCLYDHSIIAWTSLLPIYSFIVLLIIVAGFSNFFMQIFNQDVTVHSN